MKKKTGSTSGHLGLKRKVVTGEKGGHTGICISVYSSWPSLSSNDGSVSSASSCHIDKTNNIKGKQQNKI